MTAATDAVAGRPTAPAGLVLAAFAAIYFVWGSTYLAIRIVVETLPPLGSAAIRHLVAGAILYAWSRARGGPEPRAIHWRSGFALGALLLLGGNGGVSWAETRVPSGVASLLIATVSLWMIVLPALRPGGARPRRSDVGGLALGFAGVWILVDPLSGGAIHVGGALVLVLSALSWACGSLLSRHVPLPKSPFTATAVQMLGGGALLAAVSLLAGEWRGVSAASFSTASLLGLAYLIVFGSLVAFTAYVWLLRVSSPAKVATYAYVNPLVAVSLGSIFLAEPLTPRVFAATALIVGAVVLTTLRRRRP